MTEKKENCAGAKISGEEAPTTREECYPFDLDLRCHCKDCEGRTTETYSMRAICSCGWSGQAVIRKGDGWSSTSKSCPNCGRYSLNYEPLISSPSTTPTAPSVEAIAKQDAETILDAVWETLKEAPGISPDQAIAMWKRLEARLGVEPLSKSELGAARLEEIAEKVAGKHASILAETLWRHSYDREDVDLIRAQFTEAINEALALRSNPSSTKTET